MSLLTCKTLTTGMIGTGSFINNGVLTSDGVTGKKAKCSSNVFIDSNGQLGIGQSSPSAMVDIVCRAAGVSGIEINGAENQSAALLKLFAGDTSPTQNFIEINTFGGSGGNLFVINREGHIGVTLGGGAPNEPIHVNSTYDGNRAIRMQNESEGTKAVARFICDVYGGSGFLAAYGANFTTSGSKRAGSCSVIANASLTNGLSLVARHTTGGYIRFYTGGNADANERLRIDNTGLFSFFGNIDLSVGFVYKVNSIQVVGAQQPHIADANGTLADITTKFNTLLSQLENHGLNASS